MNVDSVSKPSAVPAPKRRMSLDAVREGRIKVPFRILCYGPEKVGKAQPLDALVLTPSGFIPMAEIVVGADVVGGDGRPTRVTGVHPQGTKPVYRVVMSDGAETECCDDHLWATRTVDECIAGKPSAVRSLRQIRETLLYRAATENNGPYANHRVPVVGEVRFAEPSLLPLDPYLLGLLLGDGSLTNSSITFHKPEPDVLDRLASKVPAGDTVTVFLEGKALRIIKKQRDNTHSATWLALRDMGLIGTDSSSKFIPSAYLTADVNSRVELLRGLTDTDGHVQRSGRAIEYSTSSKQLRDGFIFLARSLGGLVTITERIPVYAHHGEKKSGALSYRLCVSFPAGLCPVSSAKNRAKWREASYEKHRSIVEVELVGDKPCQCITVEADDGLYVTDDFVVTHNSTFAAGAPSPIWLGADSGTEHLNIKRLPSPDTFRDVLDGLDEVATRGKGLGFQTLVVDPIGWIEPMMILDFTRDPAANLATWGGGHGAGYQALGDRYRMLLSGAERVWKAGLNVILIGHASVKIFNDPEGPGYERYELAVDKRGAGPIKQWVDAILFAKREAFGKTDEQKKTKAYGSAAHMLHTKWSPAYDAGNRYTLPETMPLSWDVFASALARGEIEAASLREQIEAGVRELADPEVEKKVRAYLADPRIDVAEIANSVAAKLGEKRAQQERMKEGTAS